jgi:hypothetical protein
MIKQITEFVNWALHLSASLQGLRIHLIRVAIFIIFV